MPDSLGAAAFTVLQNQSRLVTLGDGRDFHIVGLGDVESGHLDARTAFAGVPAGAAVIVLSHGPDPFPELPAGVALMLAGHTHGGQVRLPGLGAVVTMSRLPRAMAYGLHERAGTFLYVTAGIGTTTLPIRLACPPEIVLVTLSGRDEGEP